MHTITAERLAKLIRDGLLECRTDVSPSGFVEVRWTKNGKVETICIRK